MDNKLRSIVAIFIAFTMIFTVACSSDEKIDVINEVTESNVEEITSEYKMLLAYFQELKTNLEELSDIRNGEGNAENVEGIKSYLEMNREELEASSVKFVDLVDAKQQLIKAYKVIEDAADNVNKDVEVFDKDIEEYKLIFASFNKQMTSARVKIEAVKSEKAEELNDPKAEEESETKDDAADKEKTEENKNQQESIDSSLGNQAEITNEDPAEYKPSSNLNDSLKQDIYNAGFGAGQSYKESGGSQTDIQAEAARQFDGIEGDNPIDKNNVSEAKRIFIEAFLKGYNS